VHRPTQEPTTGISLCDRNGGTRLSTVAIFAASAISLFFLIIAATRRVVLLPSATLDDQLFMNNAIALLSGRWLGNYSETTLVKGIGYPLFLVINNALGTPIAIGQSAIYVLACIYFSFIIFKIARSQAVFVVLLVIFLIAPDIYDVFTSTINRDFFYTSAVMFLMAAVINLLLVRELPRSLLASILWTGIWGGWVWLTREEGIWLCPALAVVIFVAVLKKPRHLLRPTMVSCACALLVAASLVFVVALINSFIYGRFIVNEINDSYFLTSVNALQRASYQYSRPYVPVPKSARLHIYSESPVFRRLKSYLDPDDAPSPYNFGCVFYPSTCGDIAGGWFIWALRDGATQLGVHDNASNAAQFYQSLAEDVNTACAQGRLRCATWLPQPLPPMTWEQVRSIPKHLARVAGVMAMVRPIKLLPDSTYFEGLVQQAWRDTELLNLPDVTYTRLVTSSYLYEDAAYSRIVVLTGWFRPSVDEWFNVKAVGSTHILEFARFESPDVAKFLSNRGASNHRFRLVVGCERDPCTIRLVSASQSSTEVTLSGASKVPLLAVVGSGVVVFELIDEPGVSLKRRIERTWLQFVLMLQPLFTMLACVGGVTFLFALIRAALTRKVPLLLSMSIVFATAAVSRILILGLIDASSFPADTYRLTSPAIPFVMASAILSIASFCRETPGLSAALQLVRCRSWVGWN
jgi:hypothetical protein